MMNSQPSASQQASFQNQMHQQAQNSGQQRPSPNGVQKPMQGQQQSHNLNANYDPRLALWALEKTKSDETWADVDPERLRMSLQDMQSELTKFQRKKGSPISAFEEITSSNCRRTINQLVEDQTAELQKLNKTLQYTIAGVLTDWRTVRHGRQLKRVRVILATQPSGFQDPQMMKTGAGGPVNAQDPNKSKQAGLAQGQMNGQGQQQQPQRNIPSQGQNMGQNPQFDQRPPPPPPHPNGGQGHMHNNGNGPPPPPPHHGGGQGQGPPPPPPPPPGVPPPPPAANYPHVPGAFPGASMPMHSIRPGKPPVQVLDPFMHSHKQKRNVRLDTSSSDSSSGWESESVSEGSGPTHLGNVEHGEYGYVGKRGERAHSRHSFHGKKKSKHYRSHSGVRSRSRSRDPRHRSSKQRRGSDHIESFARGRHSPVSGRRSPASGRHSVASSPPSSPKLPSVHIHMDGGKSSGDERGHSYGKRRDRRDRSIEASPSRRHRRHRRDMSSGSRRMSRGSSQASWASSDHGSGTTSFATSSGVNTADDGIFDRPRGHGRTNSYSHQHGSYDGFDRRHPVRDSRADDYPGYGTSPPRSREQYSREPAFNSRPTPLRRQTTQGVPNPFASDLPHRRPMQQAYDYAAEAVRYPLPHQTRYDAGNSPQEDRFKMDQLADALLERMAEPRRGNLRQSHTDRRDAGIVNDEWERYPSSRGRSYGGDRYR